MQRLLWKWLSGWEFVDAKGVEDEEWAVQISNEEYSKQKRAIEAEVKK